MKIHFLAPVRIGLVLLAGWSGLPAARGSGLPNTAPAVPSQSFAAALSPAQWKQVEDCVDHALSWIASQQAADGSFPTTSPQAQPAITGLCVLAFLSRGHQPGFGPYGAQMDRAIDFVMGCQRSDGLFSFQDPDAQTGFIGRGGGRGSISGQAATYNHAIAGLMLGEVFGHANAQRTKQIKQAMEKALQFTRELQTRPKAAPEDKGGWRYLRVQFSGADSDLSVTGWHLMFLRSARNAEFNVPQKYIDDAMGFVRRCWVEEDGLFHYTAQGDQQYMYTRGLMGSAIVSLALAGQHQSPQALAAGDWLLAHPFQFFGERIGSGNDRFFYSTYYCSQAAAQLGGRYWKGIFPPIARILVQAQQADGSFPLDSSFGGGGRRGGRGGGGEGMYGQVYITALAVLSLTPAYQLLPVYQR